MRREPDTNKSGFLETITLDSKHVKLKFCNKFPEFWMTVAFLWHIGTISFV